MGKRLVGGSLRREPGAIQRHPLRHECAPRGGFERSLARHRSLAQAGNRDMWAKGAMTRSMRGCAGGETRRPQVVLYRPVQLPQRAGVVVQLHRHRTRMARRQPQRRSQRHLRHGRRHAGFHDRAQRLDLLHWARAKEAERHMHHIGVERPDAMGPARHALRRLAPPPGLPCRGSRRLRGCGAQRAARPRAQLLTQSPWQVKRDEETRTRRMGHPDIDASRPTGGRGLLRRKPLDRGSSPA